MPELPELRFEPELLRIDLDIEPLPPYEEVRIGPWEEVRIDVD